MLHLLRFFLVPAMLMLAVGTMTAQSNWRTVHEVKKGETIFGISQSYGLTMNELITANPQLAQSTYQLKKGEKLNIPYPTGAALAKGQQERLGTVQRPIRMGIMLPLNNENADGRRMVEYYRGLLMAIESLKKQSISVEIHAWNVAESADISKTLSDPAASKLDLIIGPLYSKQMQALSDFVAKHNIMLLVPFSISAPQLQDNPHIFQVYQSPAVLDQSTAIRAASWFKDFHPVIIDCGDSESTKGAFTAAMRKSFEQRNVSYNLTSLSSPSNSFVNAFDANKRNLVILNSSKHDYLEKALSKLGLLASKKPGASITLLGYNEWIAYTSKYENYFHEFDLHIPSTYYSGLQDKELQQLKQLYRNNFHQNMPTASPVYSLTGYDHAMYFLRGLNIYGKAFDGAEGRMQFQPVQTPLKFVRSGKGGYQNQSFMFIHYTTDRRIETIAY